MGLTSGFAKTVGLFRPHVHWDVFKSSTSTRLLQHLRNEFHGWNYLSVSCHEPHLLHINQRCCTLQLCHSCHDGKCFLLCKALLTTEHLLIWSAQLKILQVEAKLHKCVLTFSTEATQGKQVKNFGGILLNSWLSIVPPKSNFQNPHVAVSLQPPPFLVSASLLYKFKSCHASTMMTKGPAFGGETFIPSASSSWTS